MMTGNNLYIVIVVLVIIFAGLFIQIILLENKVKKLEKKAKELKPGDKMNE